MSPITADAETSSSSASASASAAVVAASKPAAASSIYKAGPAVTAAVTGAQPAKSQKATAQRKKTKSKSKLKVPWTSEEDATLRSIVLSMSVKNWQTIVEKMPTARTPAQCAERWNKVLKPGMTKQPWSKEEDKLLFDLVAKHGSKRWSLIATSLPGRIGKQCRERWHNHCNPNVNKRQWSEDEGSARLQKLQAPRKSMGRDSKSCSRSHRQFNQEQILLDLPQADEAKSEGEASCYCSEDS